MAAPNTPTRATAHADDSRRFTVSGSVSLLAVVLLWLPLLLNSGWPSAEFSLADDHEIIRLAGDVRSSQSTLDVGMKWIRQDLADRLRPVYYLHKLAEVSLFGPNLRLWSLYTGLLGPLTALGLFWFGRRAGLGAVASALLPSAALFGPQASIYWRLGDNEAPGMLLAAAALLALTRISRQYRHACGWATSASSWRQ